MAHESPMLSEQPTDTQNIQCIIDELQLAARQCFTQEYELPVDPANHMQVECIWQMRTQR